MSRHSKLTLFAVLALVVGLLAVASAGAGKPAGDGGAQPPGLDRAVAAQEKATPGLLRKHAVVGTAVGVGDDGGPEVLVLAKRSGVRGIPSRVDGVPVDVVVTGPLSALHHRSGHGGGPPGGGGGDGGSEDPAPSLAPTDTWPRPVPIGVSTGRADECAAGTIGARVKDASGNVYALSNNHVYAKENDAAAGDRILQPGRYDLGCAQPGPEHDLGTLVGFAPIVFDGTTPNRVDAAIASTTTGTLGTATPSSGYGTPTSATAPAVLGQAVQKFGRTTALTNGTVTGVNATVRVGYSSGTALFVDQIIVETRKAGFIKSGDSGSLLVTDPTAEPVGLLFAGNNSGKLAIANDVDDVLTALSVTVDGR
ncbi:MAG: hypothetical protein WD993_03245 [Thermoleophilaceae bacterium]